jgi:hypothetical protein
MPLRLANEYMQLSHLVESWAGDGCRLEKQKLFFHGHNMLFLHPEFLKSAVSKSLISVLITRDGAWREQLERWGS